VSLGYFFIGLGYGAGKIGVDLKKGQCFLLEAAPGLPTIGYDNQYAA
jgi:hypothetical protein